MGCYFPNWVPYGPDRNGKFKMHFDQKRSATQFTPDKKLYISNGNPWTWKLVPCGKCIGCRLNYSSQWATRCMQEASLYKNNYFITLTYDPEHIHITEGINKVTGNIELVGTLVKKDLQDFMKRLRINWERWHNWKYENDEEGNIINYGIRYYACGEYGDHTARPHYHIIAFNLPIFDLKPLCKKNGNLLWMSEEINKTWGMGVCNIGEVTWESAAYVARYTMKKRVDNKSENFYKNDGIEKEFPLMSTHPGIGKPWYEKNKDNIYKYDSVYIKRKEKLISTKPPRYFDKLYDIEEPEEMQKIKKERIEIGEIAKKQMLKNTDLTELEYAKLREENKIEQIKKLKRNLE